MDERHKLQADLKRYGTLRRQLTDGRIIAVVEQFIWEAEARLAELGIPRDKQVGHVLPLPGVGSAFFGRG
jgi:hypothetical protein